MSSGMILRSSQVILGLGKYALLLLFQLIGHYLVILLCVWICSCGTDVALGLIHLRSCSNPGKPYLASCCYFTISLLLVIVPLVISTIHLITSTLPFGWLLLVIPCKLLCLCKSEIVPNFPKC